jgi:hypothetical protein
MPRLAARRFVTILAAAVAFAAPAATAEASGHKVSQAEAEAALVPHGIGWSSSGNCTDRNNPRCTSFEQINSGTIDGVIRLRDDSQCPVTITGGTEAGHATTTYSHWNGYKVDVHTDPHRTTCIDTYIRDHTTDIGERPDDHAPWYRDAAGNLYANEGDHWDILYY